MNILIRGTLVLLLLVAVAAPAADLDSFLPSTDEELAPLQPQGAAKTWTIDALKGRFGDEADRYRRFGAIRAMGITFVHPDEKGRKVDLALFELPSPLLAFGLFSSYRFAGEPLLELGNGGVVGDHQAFFWHGSTFVIMDGFGTDESRPEDMGRLARAVAVRLGPVPAVPPVLASFEKVAEPNTSEYLPDHLLGHDVLPPGLMGTDAAGTQIFMSVAEVDGDRTLRAYEPLLTDRQDLPWKDVIAVTGTDPEQGPVIFVVWRDRLAGALAPPDTPGLNLLLRRLLAIHPPAP